MKPLLLRVFDAVCAVAVEPGPVRDHLAFVYEQTRIRENALPDISLGFSGQPDGSFKVEADGETLLEEARLLPALLCLDQEILRRPLVLRAGVAGFHAAWLAHRDAAFFLVGPGGCGKSTLAYELGRRGFAYGADEVAALATADGRVLPFPRKIMLKADNPLIPGLDLPQSPLNLLSALDGRYYVWPPGMAAAAPGHYRTYFFFLEYQPDCQLEAVPLDTLAALEKLFAACFRLHRVNQTLYQMLVQALGPQTAFALRYSSPGAAAAFIREIRDGHV